MNNKETVIKEIARFFENSNDFNGISLSALAKNVGVEYLEILPVVKELILENLVSIQGGENPHIIRFAHYNQEFQLECIKEAESDKVTTRTINPVGFSEPIEPIVISSHSHLFCVYPSEKYLQNNLVTHKYETKPFTKRLAYGEAQLTPVYFETEVLERYFNDPRYRFEFEDYSGQISIVGTQENPSELNDSDQVFLKTFGLAYDDTRKRVVVVYLRYLSDLSSEHQMYWQSKITSKPCKMAKEYFENTVMGNWTFSQSLFSAFIEEQRLINEMSQLVFGKPLFRESFEGDKRPKEFTFFNSPTLVNYERFTSLLDKMISDNLNKKFFDAIEEYEMVPISEGVVERKAKGTLRLLEEWLRTNFHLHDETGYDRLMGPFKEVRKERQKPAHRISENYYDKELFNKQMDLLGRTYNSLLNLRVIFQQHPEAASVEIPEWIQKNEIKTF